MSYSLTLGRFVPDITYTVSPDNQSVDIGDSITITATIHRIPSCVIGGKTCTEHGMQIRAVACVPSYRNTRRGQKTNPSGVPYYPIGSTIVSFMACTQEVYQSNVQFTIDVDSRLLAGLRTTVAEAVKIGFVVTEYYLVPGISETQDQSFSGDVLTGLTISTYGYTMPTLTTMHYSDMSSKDPLTVVGNYVQNESIINLAYNTGDIYYEFKEDDSSSTCYMDFTIYNQNGDIVFDNTGNDVRYWLDSSSEGESIELPTGSLVSGTYTWNLVIEFEYGATGITTGSYVVLPYSQPELSFEITRYSEVIGDVTTYEESDDGENVWVDYEAVVSQLSGSNTCSLTLTYTPNDNGGVLPITLFSSNSGGTFTPQHGPHDRTILTSTFSSSNTYVFTATLSDVLNSYEVVVYAYRATAFFNIEKTGVAVGMRSTGDENEYDPQTGDLVTVNKKFEVASDYTSHFYGESSFEGGIVGVTTYPLLASGATMTAEELTGGKWIDGKPIYRVVIFKTVTLAASTTVATMPAYETIVSCHCLAKIGSETKPVSYSYYNNNNWEINWTIQANGNIVMQTGSSHRGSARVQFIIEYTKTTD